MPKICGKTECPMYNSQQPMLPPLVSGKPQIMIVTDSPDIRERTRIFTSESAQFLQRKVADAEILPDKSLLLATAVRCHCPSSEMSESLKTKALKCCKSYFDDLVKKYQPKLIISLGGMALTQTTKQKGVKKYQGTFYKSDEYNCYVMPLYAPGYILANQSYEETWNTGFNQIRNFIKNGWSDTTQENKNKPLILKEVQSIKGLISAKQALDGIAIDTETQGLDWTHPLFTCVSYSIAVDRNTAYQIFLFEECDDSEKDYAIRWTRKIGTKTVTQLVPVKRSNNFEEKIRELRWLLGNEKINLIMHNGNYDCHVFQTLFKVAGRFLKWPHDKRFVTINGYNFDTQNAAQLYNENVYSQASLETLQFAFSEITERYDSGDFKQKQDKGDMLGVPKDDLTKYAGLDVIVTKQVSDSLKKYLKDNKGLQRYMNNMVMPTLETLRCMETVGAYVDVAALEKATIDINALADSTHKQALSLIPKRILEAHVKAGLKLSRNNLVRDTLYSSDGFNIPPKNLTKSKEPATDQKTLKLLIDELRSKKAREFIHRFTDYKKYSKLSGTYLEGFRKARSADGRIHTKFSSCLAVTGRLSSSRPNLQNIPNRGDAAKVVRRIIAAPPGHKILSADASQAELRWMAHYSQDPAMLKVFRDGIIDIHTATAIDIVNFNDPTAWNKLSPEEQAKMRKAAKPANFGFVYGMIAQSFVTYAKVEYGVDVTDEQAEAYRTAYFTKYHGLPVYYDKMVAYGKKHGYVESALKRRRHLPELNSTNKGLFNQAMRMAINFPIQSASSDSVLLAANEIRKMDLPKRDFKLALFIHDELVAVVREDCDIDKYARILRDSIENPPLKDLFGVNLTVPLKSDVEWGDNLNDCVPWEF